MNPMEKIVITRTTEEVIENPRLVLENLQYELKNIDTERKRLKKLENEILENINLICSSIPGYIVNITEDGNKQTIHEYDKKKNKNLELDVIRGDRVFLTMEEAEHYVKVNSPEEKAEVEPVSEKQKEE